MKITEARQCRRLYKQILENLETVEDMEEMTKSKLLSVISEFHLLAGDNKVFLLMVNLQSTTFWVVVRMSMIIDHML